MLRRTLWCYKLYPSAISKQSFDFWTQTRETTYISRQKPLPSMC